MSYLLDTNAASAYIRGQPDVVRRVQRSKPSVLGISAITAVELRFGASRRNNRNLTAAVDAFLSGISIHPFDDEAADEAGRLRARLESEGSLIGLADTLIAAHAVALGSVLVTNDSDFERVSGLQREDWTK